MPYIKQEDRKKFDDILNLFQQKSGKLLQEMDRSFLVGELNYLISRILHIWVHHNGLCYTTLNSAIGVLECCKQELYRQIVAPYEDKKKEENGSVSHLDGK